MSKTVGPHAYTLIENDDAAITMGCKSSCVYQRDEEAGTRFCFKTGDLPVTCEDSLSSVVNIKIQNNLRFAVTVRITVTPGPQPALQIIGANEDDIVTISGNSQILSIIVSYNGITHCQTGNNPPGTLFTINPQGNNGCTIT